MVKLWDEYVKRNGLIVSDAGPFAKSEPGKDSAHGKPAPEHGAVE